MAWCTGRCQVRRPEPLSGKAIFFAISGQAVLIGPINCGYGKVQWVGAADETVCKRRDISGFFFGLVGNYGQLSVKMWHFSSLGSRYWCRV